MGHGKTSTMEYKINGSLLGRHLPPGRAAAGPALAGEHVGTQNMHRHLWEMGQGHLRYIPALRMKTPQPTALSSRGAQHPQGTY